MFYALRERKGRIVKMKNKWKGIISLGIVAVMFLVSCAPSSVVRVTDPKGKVIAENQQNSSQKDPEKKQQVDAEKPNASNIKNTKDDKGQSISKGQSGNEGGASAVSGGASGISSSGSGFGDGSGSDLEAANQPQQPPTPPTPPQQPTQSVGVFSPAGTQSINTPYDGTTLVTIPAGAKTVAAAGIYADMVEMLGGTLTATSPDNLGNNLFTSVFQNASGAKPFMPSNGETMTQDQATLLANMPVDQRPQVVIADSATFSGANGQAAQNILTNAQIQTQLMEDNIFSDVVINKFDDEPFTMVLRNVYYIGQILKEKCTVNDGQGMVPADKMAQEFKDYYAEKINGGSNSLHIKYRYSGITNVTSFTQYTDGVTINPSVPSKNLTPPSSLQEYWNNLEFAQEHYNWTQDAIQNNIIKPASVSDDNWSKYMGNSGQYQYYATTYQFGLENNFFSSALEMVNVQNLYTNDIVPYVNNNFYNLHLSPGYPSGLQGKYDANDVIVRSKYDPNGNPIKLMAYKSIGAVQPRNYPIGQINLHVQPVGIHSWTNGSPESLLEPLWLATIFQNNSGIDIGQRVSDFYSKFYHCNLNADQINSIINRP